MNRLQRERLMEKLEYEMRSEQYVQQAKEEQEKDNECEENQCQNSN